MRKSKTDAAAPVEVNDTLIEGDVSKSIVLINLDGPADTGRAINNGDEDNVRRLNVSNVIFP